MRPVAPARATIGWRARAGPDGSEGPATDLERSSMTDSAPFRQVGPVRYWRMGAPVPPPPPFRGGAPWRSWGFGPPPPPFVAVPRRPRHADGRIVARQGRS